VATETPTLTPEHREYLNNAAITDPIIEAAGVYSTDDGIMFPYRDGNTEVQYFRHDDPPEGTPKYLGPKDISPIFNVLREHGDHGPVLVVEGTKQALSCGSWAPPEYSVYGMNGCWGWTKADRDPLEGRTVFVVLDKDAQENPDVYNAGASLAEDLRSMGSTVLFVRLPVRGKEGLDDWLAATKADRRTERFALLIAGAKPKPADRKPDAKKKSRELRTAEESASMVETAAERGMKPIAVNRGLLIDVIDQITDGLLTRDGTTLFNHGGALSEFDRDEHMMVQVTEGRFRDVLVQTCLTVNVKDDGSMVSGWPDGNTMKAVSSRAKRFVKVRRIMRAPFVRADGTICSTPGYDVSSSTFLDIEEDFKINVPDEPTADQVKEAVSLLLDEWLCDMAFPEDSDRANALAMLLTPFVRDSVNVVPLAVVTGLQMGSAKNLLADCCSLVFQGTVTQPGLLPENDDNEVRKQVTSILRKAPAVIVFDETHLIESKALAGVLTAETWTDRLLGVSDQLALPNQATWISLGNNVAVNGDMRRRYYPIRLHPTDPNPQDKPTSAFRHPDLKAWTEENRSELLSAVLTLIRAWHVAGKPYTPGSFSFGSFERWQRTVGGVLQIAGVEGFLGGLQEARDEGDFTTGWWIAHLAWLLKTFGGAEFIVRAVKARALAADDFEAPPGKDLADPSEPNWAKRTGQEYARIKGRWFGETRLVKVGLGHGSTVKWRVDVRGEEKEPPPFVQPDPDPPTPDEGTEEAVETTFKSVGFDLETAGADELYLGRHEGPFIRLGGSIDAAGVSQTSPSSQDLIRTLTDADEIYGHGIFRFDIPALARHKGTSADFDALADKAVDTIINARLLDPPAAKGANVSYTLDAVAARLGVARKTDDIKALADKHGGFDKIPVDDPDYVSYLEGDLVSTRAVYEAQKPLLRDRGLDDYAAREMRIAAIQNRMTFNGFRIDVPLLEERVRAEENKRQEALRTLADTYGVPLDKEVTRGRGKNKVTFREPLLSPLASNAGKAALIAAFKAAGADCYPPTATGGLATSSEALGEGFYFLGKGQKMRKVPGMLRAYPDLPGVRDICELVSVVTGVTAKYAEIQKYVVKGRVYPGIGEDQASGRWAMTRPSITNLGKRGGKVVQRAVFLPEEGHVIIAADFSQVDMRAVAGLCQDPLYMAMFEPGKDMHTEIAAMMGVSRDAAKPLNHGANYGLGAKAMILQGHDPELVAKFFEVMSRFKAKDIWTEDVRRRATSGLLYNSFGRPMRCDPKRAYTQGPALMGQGEARDIMTKGLLRAVKLLPDIRDMLRVVVHDEAVNSVPIDRVEEVTSVLHEAMTFTHNGVQIIAEISAPGSDWAAAYGAK